MSKIKINREWTWTHAQRLQLIAAILEYHIERKKLLTAWEMLDIQAIATMPGALLEANLQSFAVYLEAEQ